ncbi:ECF RNA polymerase sigma factor SigL [Planctomycetes bacterium MalM25]|nr:ECF RNA polymerase sigma factor SigL [Planctomycetes bacterium MalM25]
MSTLTSPPPPHSGCRLGDPERWVDEHGEALMRYALLRVRDQATAEDLVQETLLSAWRGRGRYDGLCEPRTWLVAILKRRVADHFRKAGRQPETEGDPAAEPASRDTACDAESAEFWSVLTGCTGKMPPHLARAFRLRTFGHEEPTAICDAEGISRKNLSVRLHRARQLLRRCLELSGFGAGRSAPR